QVELADQLLVEDSHFAVEDESGVSKLTDGGGELRKALCVVDTVTAQKPNARAVLVGQDPPAVDLFLVHPAITVERLRDERGEPRVDGGQHRPTSMPAPSTGGTRLATDQLRGGRRSPAGWP